MHGRATFTARLNEGTIRREGSTLTLIGADNAPLPNALPLKAIKVDDQRQVSRFRPVDGEGSADKPPVLFKFAGPVYAAGTVKNGTRVLCAGIPYRVDTIHPQLVSDVCVELPVVAFKD